MGGPPVWTPDDQDKALAFRRYLGSLCAGCGAKQDDVIDPATGEPYYPPRLEPYVARCYLCEEKERLSNSIAPDRRGGARIGVRPFDPDITWVDEGLRELPGGEGD